MRVVAFLQNQWFKDPERVKKIIEKSDHPNAREWYIKTFLFWGCLTGKRLQRVFGEDYCDNIIWEEASPKIGGKSNSVFPADQQHIENVILKHNPDIILCFGTIALSVLKKIEFNYKWQLIIGPHPAARYPNIIIKLENMYLELIRALGENNIT
jgi:hypothetical protein